MAISASDIVFTDAAGARIPDGALHALFPAGRVGGSTDYAVVTVTNASAFTLSSVKVWMARSAGASMALAIANGPTDAATPFPDVTISALAYSSAASKGAAVAASPTALGPGQRMRVAIRRTLSGASAATPQTARLYVLGTSPI